MCLPISVLTLGALFCCGRYHGSLAHPTIAWYHTKRRPTTWERAKITPPWTTLQKKTHTHDIYNQVQKPHPRATPYGTLPAEKNIFSTRQPSVTLHKELAAVSPIDSLRHSA